MFHGIYIRGYCVDSIYYLHHLPGLQIVLVFSMDSYILSVPVPVVLAIYISNLRVPYLCPTSTYMIFFLRL
ncbi:uncharacterized protein BP01DRAFT_178529 [Aspergillus saccharolyticus JOP 1030-1]|uniref:Uncharacterized protein n=1 Tax=Aspergillus saccharolyticus JOP 1030-1 TaxID=1450539 RepID=A0A318ZNK6_9EURO|nr:hypothetical protein BP01DRAFT_178529 [Aspergillus saccharolyticus JOP 1030-1]PYH48235.1 hypothetical protein BP01DRAFT_178529 [Aspergillus saccharolyticus JOP 1030-1]